MREKKNIPLLISNYRLLITLVSTLLIGCGQTTYTPVTGVSKSNKPYYVRGSWHYPQNHYNYDETGLASWYGPGFNGKPKATGERFNQNEITAAHKTLPLPSLVRVTDLSTEKSIVVLVDDRGPFVYEGRIIDLSLGSAKLLGTHSRGIAKVHVECLIEQSKALSDYLARYGSKGRSWIQVYREDIAPQFGTVIPGACGISPQNINGLLRKKK